MGAHKGHSLFWLTVALVVGVGPALAETIPVRSGEHRGFTRLVLDLPRQVDWRLQSEENSGTLFLKGLKAEFDLKESFRKITSKRISNITAASAPNALKIGLNCDCDIQVFPLGDRMLVVDIHDPEEPTSNASAVSTVREFNLSEAESVPTVPVARFQFPVISDRPSSNFSLALGTRSEPRAFQGIRANPQPQNETGSAIVSSFPQTPQSIDQVNAVTQAERRLLEQLGRAASQGLLTPQVKRLPDYKKNTDSPNNEAETSPPTSSKSIAAPTKGESAGINLRAETSIDHDFQKVLEEIHKNEDGENCIPDSDLEIGSWGRKGDFGQQIGSLRSQMIGEFDRINIGAAKSLVQLYIHFGFGAEALHALDTAELKGNSSRLLRVLAEIMEYGHTKDPDLFANQFDCTTHASLWAILAFDPVPADAQPNSDAVLRAISALPVHLRTYLGPIASDRLIAIGQNDTAALALRILERGLDSPDPRVKLTEANLQMAQGDYHSATDALDTVVNANTVLSPNAVVQMIDSKLAAGMPIEPETAELAGAFALEYRSQTIGAELKRVQVLALCDVGRFSEAFAELQEFALTGSEIETNRLRTQAMLALTKRADDVQFLKISLATVTEQRNAISADAENKVANRLIDLGFSDRTESLLLGEAHGSEGRTRRLLRAKSALAQLKPRRAEAEILGLTGPEAELLRAQARSMSGDHTGASEIYSKLDDQDQALAQAWLGSDWKAVLASPDPALTAVADMALRSGEEQPLTPGNSSGSLARDRSLLERSAASRVAIDELLSRLDVKAPSGTND
jgi:hypothetical protein